MNCKKCDRYVPFWNKFRRESGKGFLFNKRTGEIENICFCSKECYFAYQDLINIKNEVLK